MTARQPRKRGERWSSDSTGVAWDRGAFLALVLLSGVLGARAWLHDHPQHNPWAPLDLRDPPGWATAAKLRSLSGDIAACRAVLERSDVRFTVLPPAGSGRCLRPDRTVLANVGLHPQPPATTCAVSIAFERWRRQTIGPVADQLFGQKIKTVEHFGAYSCRRIYGQSEGRWSEHATGNAIDIAAFVLSDGTRISVRRDWQGEGKKAQFLKMARDGACRTFSTVLSPDYNAAHHDHLHLDMSSGWSGLCR